MYTFPCVRNEREGSVMSMIKPRVVRAAVASSANLQVLIFQVRPGSASDP